MAATASTMLPLGTSAPDFNLPDTSPREIGKDVISGLPCEIFKDDSIKQNGKDIISRGKGNMVSLGDFEQAPALLVIFMCNHCPYVKHVSNNLVELIKEYQEKGVAVVGINSNDVDSFPEDGPEMMAQKAKEAGFTFPYLYDETQEVAKKYRAACTPDFFLFNNKRKLVYRGQMDDSRPGNNIPVTGAVLRATLDAVLEGRQVSSKQKPSLGCNIKWKQGNQPDYY